MAPPTVSGLSTVWKPRLELHNDVFAPELLVVREVVRAGHDILLANGLWSNGRREDAGP